MLLELLKVVIRELAKHMEQNVLLGDGKGLHVLKSNEAELSFHIPKTIVIAK
jgi:hypothetical protein